ncbi:Helicase swr-1, partial [Madurella mycetomatis]
MTEIASPDPTDANSPPANPGDNGQHHEQPPSTPGLAPTESVKRESRRPSQGINAFDSHVPVPEDPGEQRSQTDAPQSNGVNAREAPNADDGPPAKRRRVRDTTPNNSVRRPKPESPPWKKVEADGPSTFRTEDGRRKSGRINTIPLELQRGDKRITRRALHGQQSSPPKNRHASTNGHVSTPAATAPKRPASSSKHPPAK